jgi:hypothetical protein
MALIVKFAVYGGLKGGNSDQTLAAVRTAKLQAAIDASGGPSGLGPGVVRIDNTNLGPDPADGVQKHFGAIVEVDGVDMPFACLENQTIDFN